MPWPCEPSHCADLSISTSWPSLSWANATVTTAGRCACSQCGGSIPHSRAGPDGEGIGFGYLQRSSLIPTAGSESCCGPLLSADRTVSLRAEMVPPNPGLRSRTRRMVRPVLGSADHATSGAGSAFGTFASAAAPKRSSHPWATLTRSPEHRHGPRHIRSTDIYIDYRCSNAVQSPPDSVLQFRRRCGPRRRPRSRCGVVADSVR